MAELAGITQSINRAWLLLERTGFLDSSRGMHTEEWRQNKREAVRELREAARALVRTDNLDAYGEMGSNLQQLLWKSILAATAPEIGIFIMSRLGGSYRGMASNLREADNTMSRRDNGFSVNVLHRVTSRILDASPSQETISEQAAAGAGDPMPPMVTPEEGGLFNRIVLRALTLSSREQRSHRNAGEAALEAFSGKFLPSMSPQDWASDDLQDRALTARMGETAAQRAGLAITVVTAINDALNAHNRHNNDVASINHWIYEVCLTESDGNNRAAQALVRRLHNIDRKMRTWLQWLDRHRDHPMYVPPHGIMEVSPRASVSIDAQAPLRRGDTLDPVKGSTRRAGNFGSTAIT